jgi:hypothetical protein
MINNSTLRRDKYFLNLMKKGIFIVKKKGYNYEMG